MAAARRVVITCAVTGAIHTPSMSTHLPVTPEEIVREAVAAAEAEAGAAILEIPTQDEARTILALKGADKVAF
jgi:uncharacterized protein (DUF849 family)